MWELVILKQLFVVSYQNGYCSATLCLLAIAMTMGELFNFSSEVAL